MILPRRRKTEHTRHRVTTRAQVSPPALTHNFRIVRHLGAIAMSRFVQADMPTLTRYSYRNATVGFTLAALYAGSHAASNATIPSSTVASAKTSGSLAFTP